MLIGKKEEVLQMKETENYEQLLQRFTKRTKQLEARQVELEDAYQEYMKLDRDLDRLKGSIFSRFFNADCALLMASPLLR